MISRNDKIFKDYIDRITDRLFKILPLFEENNEGLSVYIQSLIFELNGLPYVVWGIEQLDSDYINLLATLESLYDESVVMCDQEETHNLIRREVFKSMNIVKVIGEKATESGDK